MPEYQIREGITFEGSLPPEAEAFDCKRCGVLVTFSDGEDESWGLCSDCSFEDLWENYSGGEVS